MRPLRLFFWPLLSNTGIKPPTIRPCRLCAGSARRCSGCPCPCTAPAARPSGSPPPAGRPPAWLCRAPPRAPRGAALADAPARVRLRRPALPDLRRLLADPLLVYAAHHYSRRVGHLEVYTFARGYRDRVRVTYLQVDVLTLQRPPVPDALYHERLLKTVRNAGDSVLKQGPRKPMHRLVIRRVRRPLQDEAAVLLP